MAYTQTRTVSLTSSLVIDTGCGYSFFFCTFSPNGVNSSFRGNLDLIYSQTRKSCAGWSFLSCYLLKILQSYEHWKICIAQSYKFIFRFVQFAQETIRDFCTTRMSDSWGFVSRMGQNDQRQQNESKKADPLRAWCQ